jgi:Flp pilus assembly protein TadG
MLNNSRVSKNSASRFLFRGRKTLGQGDCRGVVSRVRRMGVRAFLSDSGIAAIEFAFIAPVFLLLATGMCQFGIVLSNYVTLEHAAASGARALAISRGDTTPVTDTKAQILASAGTLTQSNIALSYTINGTNCSTDAACSPQLASGVSAYIVATYPCNVVVMGTNFMPGCTLSVTSAERVE